MVTAGVTVVVPEAARVPTPLSIETEVGLLATAQVRTLPLPAFTAPGLAEKVIWGGWTTVMVTWAMTLLVVSSVFTAVSVKVVLIERVPVAEWSSPKLETA